jgi:hypothetical protein
MRNYISNFDIIYKILLDFAVIKTLIYLLIEKEEFLQR